ncbi:hypothetical protein ILYODFUR_006419 [Ilyodon furcidens]|uniref:Uncharacterized protein n=1 Tax=Ilyodon furcidens TaxID=33524 RepID=A0ABV0V0S3_9TELE
MATSSDFLSENQFCCSICLDIFTEPVSTPCGHTFCKTCLARHWSGKQECHCPLCKNKFSKDLKLSVNTTFREVVENFKKHHVTADATSSVKPGEVSCDICPVNKLKASKTCLVCLASFCDTHLESHLRVAALQRHKLSNPVSNLEERICKEHNRIFEFLCLNDNIHFCALCTEHTDHDTINLNETHVHLPHIKRRNGNVQKTNKKNERVQSKKKAKGAKKGKGERAENVNTHQTTAPHHLNGYNCMFDHHGIIRGKAIYEFQVHGSVGCDLAAVRASTLGTMTFPSNWDGCCILRFTLRRNTKKILLLVDYDNGLVFFLDPDNDIWMYQLTGHPFNEPILLCLIPSQHKLLSCVQSLKRRVQKIPGHVDPFCFWLGSFGIIYILGLLLSLPS